MGANPVYEISVDRIRLLTTELLVSIRWLLYQLHIDLKSNLTPKHIEWNYLSMSGLKVIRFSERAPGFLCIVSCPLQWRHMGTMVS